MTSPSSTAAVAQLDGFVRPASSCCREDSSGGSESARAQQEKTGTRAEETGAKTGRQVGELDSVISGRNSNSAERMVSAIDVCFSTIYSGAPATVIDFAEDKKTCLRVVSLKSNVLWLIASNRNSGIGRSA